MSTPISKTSPAPQQQSLSPMFYAPSASNGSSSSSSSSPRIGTPPLRRQSSGKDSLYDVTPGAKGSPQGDYFSHSPSPLIAGRRGSKGKRPMIRTASGNERPSSRASLSNGNKGGAPYFPPPPPTSGTASPLTVSRRPSGARPLFAERSSTGSPQIQTASGEVLKFKYSDQAQIYSYDNALGKDGIAKVHDKWTMTLHIAPNIYLQGVDMTDEVVQMLTKKFPYWNTPDPVVYLQQRRNIKTHVRLGINYLVNQQNQAVVATVESVKRPGRETEPFVPQSVEGFLEDKIQSVQSSFKRELSARKRSVFTHPRVSGVLGAFDLRYSDPAQQEQKQQAQK